MSFPSGFVIGRQAFVGPFQAKVRVWGVCSIMGVENSKMRDEFLSKRPAT